MALLEVACGHVVHDRVARDVPDGIARGDAVSAEPDDHAEFRLVVQSRGDVRVDRDHVAGAAQSRGGLGEDDGGVRDTLRFARIGSELSGVRPVILSQAHHVSDRNDRRKHARRTHDGPRLGAVPGRQHIER